MTLELSRHHNTSHDLNTTPETLVMGDESMLTLPPSGAHVSIVRSDGTAKIQGDFTPGRELPDDQSCYTTRSGTQIFSGKVVNGNASRYGTQQGVSSHPARYLEPGQMNIRIPSETKVWPKLHIKNATSIDYPLDLKFGSLKITGNLEDLELIRLEADKVTWNTQNGALKIGELITRDPSSIKTGMKSLKVGSWTGGKTAFQTRGARVRIDNMKVEEVDGESGAGSIDFGTLNTTGVAKFRYQGKELHIDNAQVGSIDAKTNCAPTRIGSLTAGTTAIFDTGSGDFEAKEIKADNLSVNTISGDIDIVKSDANNTGLSTTSGGIQGGKLESKSQLEMKSSSGDIYGQCTLPVNGSITTNAGSVDVTLTGEPSNGSDFTVSTISGDVNLQLKPLKSKSFKGIIEVRTGSGRFKGGEDISVFDTGRRVKEARFGTR